MSSTNKNGVRDCLSRYRQIKLSVVGRRTGPTISHPVLFVTEGEKLCLLPVSGSDTQWYQNVLKDPSIRVNARGVGAAFRGTPIKQRKSVNSVVEKFREKYGADVKKYHSKFDAAVLAKTS